MYVFLDTQTDYTATKTWNVLFVLSNYILSFRPEIAAAHYAALAPVAIVCTLPTQMHGFTTSIPSLITGLPLRSGLCTALIISVSSFLFATFFRRPTFSSLAVKFFPFKPCLFLAYATVFFVLPSPLLFLKFMLKLPVTLRLLFTASSVKFGLLAAFGELPLPIITLLRY